MAPPAALIEGGSKPPIPSISTDRQFHKFAAASPLGIPLGGIKVNSLDKGQTAPTAMFLAGPPYAGAGKATNKVGK
jgi:hypothetical protein